MPYDVDTPHKRVILKKDHKTEIVLWLVSGVAAVFALLSGLLGIWARDARWGETTAIFGTLAVAAFIGGWMTYFIKWVD